MAANDYLFVTHWRVEGSVEEVSTILDDPDRLAEWWPAVYLETTPLKPGDERNVGKVVTMYTKWRRSPLSGRPRRNPPTFATSRRLQGRFKSG